MFAVLRVTQLLLCVVDFTAHVSCLV